MEEKAGKVKGTRNDHLDMIGNKQQQSLAVGKMGRSPANCELTSE